MSGRNQVGNISGDDYAKRSMGFGISSILVPQIGVPVIAVLIALVGLPDYNADTITPGVTVFTLIGFLLMCGLFISGLFFAILALVNYDKWKKADGFNSDYAKAGKYCGIIGLVLGIIPVVIVIFLVVLFFVYILSL